MQFYKGEAKMSDTMIDKMSQHRWRNGEEAWIALAFIHYVNLYYPQRVSETRTDWTESHCTHSPALYFARDDAMQDELQPVKNLVDKGICTCQRCLNAHFNEVAQWAIRGDWR